MLPFRQLRGATGGADVPLSAAVHGPTLTCLIGARLGALRRSYEVFCASSSARVGQGLPASPRTENPRPISTFRPGPPRVCTLVCCAMGLDFLRDLRSDNTKKQC